MEEKQKKQTLTPFEREIKAHWREHRPRMNRGLKRAGELDQAVRDAARFTNEAYAHLRKQGVSHASPSCGPSRPFAPPDRADAPGIPWWNEEVAGAPQRATE